MHLKTIKTLIEVLIYIVLFVGVFVESYDLEFRSQFQTLVKFGGFEDRSNKVWLEERAKPVSQREPLH